MGRGTYGLNVMVEDESVLQLATKQDSCCTRIPSAPRLKVESHLQAEPHLKGAKGSHPRLQLEVTKGCNWEAATRRMAKSKRLQQEGSPKTTSSKRAIQVITALTRVTQVNAMKHCIEQELTWPVVQYCYNRS